MCAKVVDINFSRIKVVPECYKTQEVCNKAVKRSFLYLILFLIDVNLKKCVTELFLKISLKFSNCILS